MSCKYNEKIALEIIHKVGAKPELLVQILHALVVKFSYIDENAIRLIAKEVNLSNAEVHGTVSFYHDFRTTKAGEKIIKICQAEACQAMGSRQLTMYAESILGIKMHETSKDDNYTLEPIYCLGNCACAPGIMIDDKVFGKVDKNKFDKIVNRD